MSQEVNLCRAIVQQGENAGKECGRKGKGKENGYCVYHQRNYEYEQLIKEGKQLCGKFFRGCNNELSEIDISNKYKNCEQCRIKKSGKLFNCQYDGCDFKIKKEEDKYCKKHIRQHLRDNEIKNNIKYCDVDRGCFNKLTDGNNKCEECKDKEKEIVGAEISALREKYKVNNLNNTNNTDSKLFTKQEDKTISLTEIWRSTQRNAYSRGLLFTLSESEYENLIIRPCYYCGFYSLTRFNGIDRIDNNKGYILENCISCCKMCNMIKYSQHPNEFLDKINIICDYTSNKSAITEIAIKNRTSYLSKSSRKSYKDYKVISKERKIEFMLSEQEYNNLINGICYLCGIKNSNKHTNGIDRVDNTIRTYSLENCKTCCGHCNLMKGTYTYDDFIEKCYQIKTYNCNKDIFNNVPKYIESNCRKEFYTADDIYMMMTNGKYSKYVEWCREKDKTPEYISAINYICNKEDLSESNKEHIIIKIQDELDKERHRNTSDLDDKKMIQCTTLYCYLTQGKVTHLKEWYNENFKKSTLFDERLEELINSLPTLNRDEGVEACKKFMYDEKNRRNSQLKRESDKKVIKHTTKQETTAIQTKQLVKKRPIVVIDSSIDETIRAIHNENMIITNKPVSNSIETKVISIQNKTGYEKKEITEIKQWKVKQIYEAISLNNENQYKEYCEQNNDISKIKDWDIQWATFVLLVKGKSQIDAEKPIREFVENLKRIRHNELCYEKNSKLVDREDRQQWPATTIVRAFLEGKIDTFKEYTEEQTGDNPEDKSWQKRWDSFVKSLKDSQDNEDKLKELCSKFLTAQRTKRYRRNTSAKNKLN
jgi:hypothetical protein